MTESTITTLTQFLRQSGAKYRIVDMGRRVSKIPAEEFEQFEQAIKPYPTPFLRTALFGIIFWHPQSMERQYVWFLRFPLDEQGLLLQAARDEFLVTVLERVGECILAAAEGQRLDGALKDSPYTFNPREDKMAAFNAQATYALSLPVSHYYADAHAYFSGQKDIDDWYHLGMQGVADYTVRLEHKTDIKTLISILPSMPAQPFHMLTTFLENTAISVELTEALAWRLETELKADTCDIAHVCACLRGASNTLAIGLLSQMIERVLQHECSLQVEIMAVIVGRCWPILQDPRRCQMFIEKLALNEAGYEGFSHLLADLIYLPGLRTAVMTALRNPERSPALNQYVGQMFGR